MNGQRMIENRLATLRHEYAEGEKQLKILKEREAELSRTMIRINGAINVLEEILQETKKDAPAD